MFSSLSTPPDLSVFLSFLHGRMVAFPSGLAWLYSSLYAPEMILNLKCVLRLVCFLPFEAVSLACNGRSVLDRNRGSPDPISLL